jgi:hypothetical protein
LATIGILLALAVAGAPADELRLDARKLLGIAASDNVELSADGKSIALARGVLVEDDGPAAGYSYKSNEERLVAGVRIRKQLNVVDPRAHRAVLLIAPGGELTGSLSGQTVRLDKPGKVGGYWQSYDLPLAPLKTGLNEIELAGAGRLWIARDDEFAAGSADRPRHPNRSAKSDDDGKTWSDSQLGSGGDVDGEYYVRFWLDQHQRDGWLMLPVLDLGNLAGQPIGPPLKSLGAVRVAIEGDGGPAGKIASRIRTGPSPLADDKTWSPWQPLDDSGSIHKPSGRHLQIILALATSDPRDSPELKSMTISAAPVAAGEWHRGLRLTASDNPPVIRSSIPFEYEPLDHAKLKALREKYNLDEVAAGAKTELELIGRLAAWSAARWDKGHLQEAYPAWDCLDILADHKDGQPVGGFCQQYNVVFLQACESFGLCGRAVSLGPGDHGLAIRGGHEVVEIWSNEFRKWIYVDGNAAWYFVDRDTRIPLSLRELRERQLQTVAGKDSQPIEIIKLAESRYEWKGLAGWPPFAELRLIPRSNFLQAKSPLPLNQGMRGWFWTGHYVWTDDASPASLLYPHRVSQLANWDWTLNEAHIHLEAASTPGELRVHLDSVTPGFDSFETNVDAAGWNHTVAAFAWKLHAGKNRLEARSKNITGRAGSTSFVELSYEPAQ